MGVYRGPGSGFVPVQVTPLPKAPPPPAETWILRGEVWLYDQPGVGCYRVERTMGGWAWRWDPLKGPSVGGYHLRAEDAIAAADEHRAGKRKGVPMR